MKFKMLNIAFLGALMITLTACVDVYDDESSDLEITQSDNASVLIFEWDRSTEYGSYAQLEISNSISSTDVIATTHYDNMIITCIREQQTSYENTYQCTNNQNYNETTISISNIGDNDIYERSGTSSTSNKKRLARIYYNYLGDEDYTIRYY